MVKTKIQTKRISTKNLGIELVAVIIALDLAIFFANGLKLSRKKVCF